MATLDTRSSAPEQPPSTIPTKAPVRLPRVAIQFCTQCKWMLRAAYFAQELLSTFGPALGEVALQPATGGVFAVTIETADAASSTGTAAPRLLWDRKTEGRFPETKELKRRVRDVIEPGRDLGHVDRNYGKAATAPAVQAAPAPMAEATPTGAPPSVAGDAETKDNADAAPFCEDCQ
ncbi:selenoprotein W family protein [Sporothrix brasiliensis 5110]|uniref:Selenoprotein W family protein n=1 Tax=Sporothrix brasiliensis 5110 TaxID=1398154 RepID=A0A0C2F078_9PEZI|nr:selenoprotein W family protein [Sporothrix brasiliensis 5110]KIH92189.1 selenoprotein W family protein [Sporothrix brasiliensis 5110]